MSAKVTVPAGTCVQSSFGDMGFGSACVYLFGMIPPSSNSGEVRVRPGPGGGPPALGCPTAEAKPATKKMVAPTVSVFMSVSPWNLSAYQEGGGEWAVGRAMIGLNGRARDQVATK